MLIANSALQLSASHQSQERHERRESLVAWQAGGERQAVTTMGTESLRQRATSVQAELKQVTLSERATQLQPQKAVLEVPEVEDPIDLEQAELEVSLLKLLVESLTGKKIKVGKPHVVDTTTEPVESTSDTPVSNEDDRQGWGVIYDFYEAHYESEGMQFLAEGIVYTADGHEIAVSLNLSMSREFLSETRVNLRAGDALKDPLVINYSGTAAELSQTEFSFDIDADGRSDQIAFLKPGSGFLALDKSGDGSINDGRELFGAISGDGFADLAVFDTDDNGWIDEGDEIYDRLRIWSKDAAGNDQLMALGKRGVGAIYLGHTSTPFLLKDGDNQTLGRIRESGLFLDDERGVGSVQQIDLVV